MKTTPSGRNPVFLVNPGLWVNPPGPDWTEGKKRVVGTAETPGPEGGSTAGTGGKAGTEGGSIAGTGGKAGTEGGSIAGTGGKAGSSLIVFPTTGGTASTTPTTGVRTCSVS